MKATLKRLLPARLLSSYHAFKVALEEKRDARRTPEQVFSEIYRKRKWGVSDRPFCSGAGTENETAVAAYVDVIRPYLNGRVVDLGCGDFTVGRRLLPFCEQYIGVDVVPELIHHLRTTELKGSFLCLDIIEGTLPQGDVCLVRQVFQHLSNAQIIKVLLKLKRYETIVVTEHQPILGTPNLDKVHGSAIRLYRGSGVYLDQPPFSASTTLLLEVPANVGMYAGVIRTFLVKLAPA